MTPEDFLALLPLISVAVAIVILMLVIAFYRRHRLSYQFTLVGLGAGLAALVPAAGVSPRSVTPLLIIDGSALFYLGLVMAASLIVTVFSYAYLQNYTGQREEYYLLILLAALGSSVLVVSDHFASLFLGLEILSVSLYGLIAYTRQERQRIEAGIKYLVMAGIASAFLLFGIALLYFETGTLSFREMSTNPVFLDFYRPLILIGLGMILVGVGFKLALVPFHLWTPDVYQGAPAPITGLIATISKGAIFVLLLRFFTAISLDRSQLVWEVIAALAFASILLGNVLAVVQDNVKRLLAFSSIAHMGYLLIALLAGIPFGETAIAFYLTSYFLTSLSAFGVITFLSIPSQEAQDIENHRALFWQRPEIALVFVLALFSLAGVPPTSGLVGKILIAASGIESRQWILLAMLVIGSVISVYYYLRVVVTMFRRDPVIERDTVALPSSSPASRILLLLMGGAILVLGIYPFPLIWLIEWIS
jgi:NADH-quinone oxidoreductase subunit N